jgi:hypothetical protein
MYGIALPIIVCIIRSWQATVASRNQLMGDVEMRFSEIEVEEVANLGDVWAAIDTPIYRVLDEEGVNMHEAQLRPLDESRFLYVDSTDGYKIVTQEEIGFVEVVLDSEHEPKGYDQEGNVVLL